MISGTLTLWALAFVAESIQPGEQVADSAGLTKAFWLTETCTVPELYSSASAGAPSPGQGRGLQTPKIILVYDDLFGNLHFNADA